MSGYARCSALVALLWALAGPGFAQTASPAKALIAARDAVGPAVVSLFVRRTIPEPPKPRFRRPSIVAVAQAAGSGVIVSRDGLVITNAHVVANAVIIKAQLQDGRTIPAGALLFDRQRDLAVLRLRETDNLPVATLARTLPAPHSPVVAIGNARGEGQEASMGVMVDTEFRVARVRGPMLVTSAEVAPGESGGALVDAEGRVTGILTARIDRSGFPPLGLAIPAYRALAAVSAAKKGRVALPPGFE